ncbi:carbohydrate porin [Algoriphagus namhaensis]
MHDPNAKVGVGMYGRVGVNWNFGNDGSIGRRLNLNNMGSIGGRMEEQDYLEFGTTFKSQPISSDSTVVRVQLRAAVFSRSISFFGNNSTNSLGGLSIALPEIFVEVRNSFTKDLTFWIGNRLYRGADIHIADYFGFNDHSGQAFGIEYKNTLLHLNFVSSTDTSATVPPYFYVNIKTGTGSLQLRERSVLTLEHNVTFPEGKILTLLGEYHRMPGPDKFDPADSLNFPGGTGWVLGARMNTPIKSLLAGSFNSFSARYGKGIANGGDGGVSRTFLTYGAPNLTTNRFDNALGIELTDHILLNFSKHFTLNGYGIFHFNRGAADTKGEAPTYLDQLTFNQKMDLTLGLRGFNYLTDKFHLLSEIHHSRRQDGEQPWYAMTKLTLAPTLAPKGERSAWSRPHLRFVLSLARYNDFTIDNLYSPYLELAGPQRWGHYVGFKAEWWTW